MIDNPDWENATISGIRFKNKEEAKKAVESFFKNYISKVVVMEQISDEEIKAKAKEALEETFNETGFDITNKMQKVLVIGTIIEVAKWMRDKQKTNQ